MVKPQSKPNPFQKGCSSRQILDLVGGKWALLLICRLQSGPTRTCELQRSLEGISQKMLTQTLRDLTGYGIVARKSYPEVPPRVEYSLTPLGSSLSVLVRGLEAWVLSHYTALRKNHDRTGA